MKRLVIGAALGALLFAGCSKAPEVVYTPAPTVTVTPTTDEKERNRLLMERSWDALSSSSQEDICHLWQMDHDAGVQLVIENPMPGVPLEDMIRFFDGKC